MKVDEKEGRKDCAPYRAISIKSRPRAKSKSKLMSRRGDDRR